MQMDFNLLFATSYSPRTPASEGSGPLLLFMVVSEVTGTGTRQLHINQDPNTSTPAPPQSGVINSRGHSSHPAHCTLLHSPAHTLVNILHITRLNLVKKAKFQKWFFWYFFIRNNLSRVDLIIKVVLEFLSDP